MRNLIIKLITLSFIVLILPLDVSAHPGRTDIDGCHVCKTNCKQWDLKYGEYHCHVEKAKKARTEAPKHARSEF
jgi:competence protein ComEC